MRDVRVRSKSWNATHLKEQNAEMRRSWDADVKRSSCGPGFASSPSLMHNTVIPLECQDLEQESYQSECRPRSNGDDIAVFRLTPNLSLLIAKMSTGSITSYRSNSSQEESRSFKVLLEESRRFLNERPDTWPAPDRELVCLVVISSFSARCD